MSTNELAVRVTAPSRLHFGLLAFGDWAPRQFGGVGMMIDRPETAVLARLRRPNEPPPEPRTDADRRARAFAEQFRQSVNSADERERLRHVEIRVEKAATDHVGLGSGTQLAMAVGRALASFIGKSDMPAVDLAQRVGRGRRSAIGVHGFHLGGFLVEGGKSEPSNVSPLVARLNFPSDWPVVLVIPADSKGLHGRAEREAFEDLAPIPPAITADLCRLTMLGILPAVAERDFPAFTESLTEFSRKVGACFAAQQGEQFFNPAAASVMEVLATYGVRGVAQSSWGPTLAVVADSRFRAEWLAARLADTLAPNMSTIVCTTANNHGAKIEIVDVPADSLN